MSILDLQNGLQSLSKQNIDPVEENDNIGALLDEFLPVNEENLSEYKPYQDDLEGEEQQDIYKIRKRKKYSGSKLSDRQAKNKACREKTRRIKLNNYFEELAKISGSKKSPSRDKMSILCDSIKLVKQLQNENKQVKLLNKYLEDKVASQTKDISQQASKLLQQASSGIKAIQDASKPSETVCSQSQQDLTAENFQDSTPGAVTESQVPVSQAKPVSTAYPCKPDQIPTLYNSPVQAIPLQDLFSLQQYVQQSILCKSQFFPAFPGQFPHYPWFQGFQQQHSNFLESVSASDYQKDKELRPPAA